MSRRFGALGWLSLAGLLVGAPWPLTAQSIPVRVGGNASSLIGVEFDLPIEVDLSGRTEKLGSFALRITWDPTVLLPVLGKSADFGAIAFNQDSLLAGKLLLRGANPAGVGGRVTVGVMRLRPLRAASTTFQLSVQELYAAGTFADLTSLAVPSNKDYCPAVGRWGDLDGDGTANSRDALIALSASVGLDVSGFNAALGDVDRNGATEARDALIILSYGVGLTVAGFPVFGIAPGPCATAALPSFFLTPGSTSLVVGQRLFVHAFARDGSSAPVSVTDAFWHTSDPSVASVGPTGIVNANAAGTATIWAVRSGGDTASAQLTVLAARSMHWVDALSRDALNQIGSPGLPFGEIQTALDFARAGDTVMVRAGRYEEAVAIRRGVTLMGDTTIGGVRPTIARTGGFLPAIEITTIGNVEVHRFRLDTATVGVHVIRADTVRLRHIEYRSPADGDGAVVVDSANALRVERSRLTGFRNYGFYDNGIRIDQGIGLLVVDSTVIGDFGYYGINAVDADSVFVRGSTIRNNYSYGLYVCSDCFATYTRGTAIVLSSNLISTNGCSGVYVDFFRSAVFERNRIARNQCDQVQLYGPGTGGLGEAPPFRAAQAVTEGLVSFRGDSILSDLFDDWLYLSGYDSLSMDSAFVRVREGGGYLYGGRATVVRHTTFADVRDDALYLSAYPRDSANLVLRDVGFFGPDSAANNCCAWAVDANEVWVDADTVKIVNVYRGIQVWSGSLVLKNAEIVRADYPIEVDYGSAFIDNSVIRQTQYYPISVYSCCGERGDSLVITNSSVTGGSYYAIQGDYLRTARFDNVTVAATQYGIGVSYSALSVTNTTVTRPVYAALTFYGSDTTHTMLVDGLTVNCEAGYTATSGALRGSYGVMTVRNSTINGCSTGMQLFTNTSVSRPYLQPVVVRNNVITMGGARTDGIYVEGNGALPVVVGNSVNGIARYGSITVHGSGMRSARVDSNTVTGGFNVGIYASYADSIRIRDNTITNHGGSQCCFFSRGAGIMLQYNQTSAKLARVTGNRLTTLGSNGIYVQRNSGDTVRVAVDSNSVKAADSTGIYVTGYGFATLTRNAVDGSQLDGILIDRFTGGTDTAVVVNQNNLTNNKGYGVRNADCCLLLDGTNNWWNHASGPSGVFGDSSFTSTGDSVSQYVRWSPWRMTAVGDAPTPAAPALAARVRPDLQLSLPTVTRAVWDEQRIQERRAAAERAAPEARQTARVERQDERAEARDREEERRRELRRKAVEARATKPAREPRVKQQ